MSGSATKPALHQSQIAMMLRCPLQYSWRYVEGIVAPPGVAMVIGTATHRAIEADLSAKIATGALLPAEAVADLAAEALETTWAGEEPALSPEERELGETAVRGDAKDWAVKLSGLHHQEIAPALLPTHVERTFRLDLVGLPVDLVGTIDVVEGEDGDSRWRRVRDTKTTANSPPETAAEKSEQLTAYGLAVRTLDGVNPADLALDHLVKNKTPKAVTQFTTRSEDDYRLLLELVANCARIIQAGVFLPAPRDPSAWWCSEKFCGYWDRCPYGARQRTVHPVSIAV